MTGSRSITFLVVALAAAASCARDSQALFLQHLQRGDRFSAEGKTHEAIIDYRLALQLRPESSEARRKLGERYLEIGDQLHALGELSRAADLLPGDLGVQLQAGRLHQLSGQFQDAIMRADRALAIDPRSPDAAILKGSALLGLRDLEGASAAIEAAIAMNPGESRVYSALGGLQLSAGQITQASELFQKAIAVDPQSLPAHIALGYFLWTTRRVGDAEATFKRALAIDPQSELVNRLLATLMLSTRRVGDAEQYLKALADSGSKYQIALADYYLAQKRFADAEKFLQSIAADRSLASLVTLRFAAIQLAQGRLHDANSSIQAVLLDEPRNPAALLARAQLLAAQDRVPEAISAARAVADNDETNATARYMLGQFYARTRETTASITAFQDALRLNPLATAPRVELAKVYLATGDHANAKVQADEALRADPQNPEIRVLLGRSLLGSGDVKRADAEVQSLLQRYPQASSVHALAGALQLARNDAAAARRSLERALALDTDNFDALRDLVTLHARANRFDEAERLIAPRLANRPHDTDLMLLAAQTYTAGGDLPSAEQMLTRLISEDTSNLSAYGMLGEIYISANRLEAARIEYEKAAAQNPKSVAAHTIVAMILEAQGKPDEASQRYQRVLDIESNAPVAANNLAWLRLERKNDLEAALSLAQQAKERLPNDARINDTLGWIYYQKKLSTQAVAVLEQSVAREPSNALHQYHLGRAYMQAGDYIRARQALERALLDPDFSAADEARKALTMLPI